MGKTFLRMCEGRAEISLFVRTGKVAGRERESVSGRGGSYGKEGSPAPE